MLRTRLLQRPPQGQHAPSCSATSPLPAATSALLRSPTPARGPRGLEALSEGWRGTGWAATESNKGDGGEMYVLCRRGRCPRRTSKEEAPGWLPNPQEPSTKKPLRQPPRHPPLRTRALTLLHAQRAHTQTRARSPCASHLFLSGALGRTWVNCPNRRSRIPAGPALLKGQFLSGTCQHVSLIYLKKKKISTVTVTGTF